MMSKLLLLLTYIYVIFFLSAVIIVWPCLTLPVGVFTKGYFGFWVAISLAWGLFGSIVIIGLPLYEGKASIEGVIYGMLNQPIPMSSAEMRTMIQSLESRVKILEGMNYVEGPEKINHAMSAGTTGFDADGTLHSTV